MSISIFELKYSALYPLFDVWLVLYAVFIVSTRKRTSKLSSKSIATLGCYGLLGALSSYSCSGISGVYHPLSIAALPLLDIYVEDGHLLQLVNAVGVFRAISNSNVVGWLNLLGAATHMYLFCTRLGDKGLQMLKDIKERMFYTKELRLISIQKVRNIVPSDIEALPKRMLLESALDDFKYNVNERMFLLKAIFRMMWQPMIPLLALTAFLNAIKVMSNVANSRVFNFFDAPLENSWYGACFNIVVVIVLTNLSGQLRRVESFVNKETTRVIDALKFTLFRLPLLNDGLQNNYRIREAQGAVGKLVDGLKTLFSTFSTLTKIIFNWVYLYNTIGRLAFIPLAMNCLHVLLRFVLTKFTGPKYKRSFDSFWDNHDDKIGEIFYNIRSIKLFGWERMYTDPKLIKHWEYVEEEKHKRWCEPIAKAARHLVGIFDSMSSQIFLYLSLLTVVRSGSDTATVISLASMLQMERQMSVLQYGFDSLIDYTSLLSAIVETAYTIEQVLKGDYINTLRRNSLTLEKEQSVGLFQQESHLSPIVSVKEGEFAWTKDKPVVKNVSFEANPGDLVAVVGKTGSGKSSLLMSICGEVEMTKGIGAVVGSIALVEQTPWIMSGTLRENILFGRDYDEEFYNKVVFACALSEDIVNWKDGDRTRIGERGMNVSGGQKARIALARAVYSRADTYILDDPLSAVDALVMRHLLDHVIMDTGILAGKIRIMSLHESRLLPYFNTVLQLEKDKDVVTLKQDPQKYQPKPLDVSSVPKNTPTLVEKDNAEEGSVLESELDEKSSVMQNNEDDGETGNEHDTSSSEKRTYSNWESLWYTIRLLGLRTLLIMVLPVILSPISRFVFENYRLAALKEGNKTDAQNNTELTYYLLLCIMNRNVWELSFMPKKYVKINTLDRMLRINLNSKAIDSIIHAPISFYDSKTRPEIVYPYSRHSNDIAVHLPSTLDFAIENVLSDSLSIFRIGMNAPYLLVIMIVVAWVSNKSGAATTPVKSVLQSIYNEACVDESKVEDVIADGQHLIRIFNVEKQFTSMYIKEKSKMQDIKTTMSLFNDISSSSRLLVDTIYQSAYKIALVLQKQMFKDGLLSAEFIMLENLIRELNGSMDVIMDVIPNYLRDIKGRMDRFREYTSIERESLVKDNALVPEEGWPLDGKIEFKNFSMKYHQDLEYVLKDINLTINPREKLGIVGRTGAGKTSLTRCLFQLISKKTCNGSILIDGHDTFSMNRRDVRAKLGIIPQDSTLFWGTIRKSLDPLVKYSVEDIWSAILKCGIGELVQPKNVRKMTDDEKIIAGGKHDNELKEIDRWNKKWNSSNWAMRAFLYLFVKKPELNKGYIIEREPYGLNQYVDNNLSGGQKQLVGLCRLLMRNRKIIVLDEATARVDQESDQDMQKLIRSEFKDCTVLTIAHRLKTIMGSDRIVVMDNGRVVEVGPPSELLEKGGYFAELVKANEF